MSFYNDASLIFLPSAGKDTKAYSAKPTDGSGDFTFSRGSNLTATRVGPTGLIEKGRENLIKYSNNFDIASTPWFINGSASVSSSTETDPFGGTDSWELTFPNASGDALGQAVSVSTSTIYTWSLYMKTISGTLNVKIGNINSGVYETKSVTTEWQRFEIYQFPSGTTRYPNISTAEAGSVLIFGAQLEVGLAATDYIESGASTGKAGLLENEPRFDYSGGASCPALLLEPQRTNLFKYSEYANGNTFSNLPIVTDNYAVSPEGIQNAFRVQDTDGSNFKSIKLSAGNVIVSANSEHTISVFVKKAIASISTYSGFSIEYTGTSNQISYIIFDEYNGTLTAIQSQSTLTLHDVKDFGDYWRFSVSGKDTGGNTQFNTRLYACLSSNGTSPSLGTKDYTAYGLQCEQGSYPTSYIPNHSGGSVTRNADSSTLSSIINGDAAFTFMIESGIQDYGSSVPKYFDAGALGYINHNTINTLRYRLGGSNYVQSISGLDSFKFLLRYDGSEIKVYFNGSLEHTISASLSGSIGLSLLGGLNKQVLLFPTALSDTQCVILTS